MVDSPYLIIDIMDTINNVNITDPLVIIKEIGTVKIVVVKLTT